VLGGAETSDVRSKSPRTARASVRSFAVALAPAVRSSLSRTFDRGGDRQRPS
jgi:hypothetical protein